MSISKDWSDSKKEFYKKMKKIGESWETLKYKRMRTAAYMLAEISERQCLLNKKREDIIKEGTLKKTSLDKALAQEGLIEFPKVVSELSKIEREQFEINKERDELVKFSNNPENYLDHFKSWSPVEQIVKFLYPIENIDDQKKQ